MAFEDHNCWLNFRSLFSSIFAKAVSNPLKTNFPSRIWTIKGLLRGSEQNIFPSFTKSIFVEKRSEDGISSIKDDLYLLLVLFVILFRLLAFRFLSLSAWRYLLANWLALIGRFQRDNDETKQKWGNIKHHLWHFIFLFFFWASRNDFRGSNARLSKQQKVEKKVFLRKNSWFHTWLRP